MLFLLLLFLECSSNLLIRIFVKFQLSLFDFSPALWQLCISRLKSLRSDLVAKLVSEWPLAGSSDRRQIVKSPLVATLALISSNYSCRFLSLKGNLVAPSFPKEAAIILSALSLYLSVLQSVCLSVSTFSSHA